MPDMPHGTGVGIEFVGGPRDGQRLRLGTDDLAALGDLPERFGLRDGERDAPGHYEKSRKLTRDGRLIYEFRGGAGTCY